MNPIPKMATTGGVPSLKGKGGCYCGRRGLPAKAVATMYADYLRLGSLEKAGALHGRTRQSMFGIFKNHGLELNAKRFLPVIEYKGRKFTEQKTQGRHRYLRATVRKGRTIYLHHLIWEEAHGPIPFGHKVCFKDGNHRNCALDNLELLTNSEQVRKYASKGENHATKTAKARLTLMLAGKAQGFLPLLKGAR